MKENNDYWSKAFCMSKGFVFVSGTADAAETAIGIGLQLLN